MMMERKSSSSSMKGMCVSCSGRRGFILVTAAFISGLILFFAYSSSIVPLTSFSNIRPWPQNYLHAHTTAGDSLSTSSSSNNSSSSSQAPRIEHNITVVTAFIDIGEFGKGDPSHKRDSKIYLQWSQGYAQLQAPVVMYTNSESFANHFQSVRQELKHLTEVVRIEISTLWSFRLKSQIAGIYARGYPRHWPNTVYPEYTCVTHAKFDFLRDVVERGYFPSGLLAWMDVGYLRNIAGKEKNTTDRYAMWPPPDFDSARVMCGEVFRPNFNNPWKSILRRNLNWVAGGFFLATRQLMGTFVEQYRRAVLEFLKRRESQVEQHILYAMYTKEGRAIVKPTVELQAPHGDWFDVGFKCMHLLKPPTHETTHAAKADEPTKKSTAVL